jgi:hypothetical protein
MLASPAARGWTAAAAVIRKIAIRDRIGRILLPLLEVMP